MLHSSFRPYKDNIQIIIIECSEFYSEAPVTMGLVRRFGRCHSINKKLLAFSRLTFPSSTYNHLIFAFPMDYNN